MPIALVLVTSVRSFDDIAANGLGSLPHSFTLSGFRQAWVDGGQGRALLNSLLVSIPTVLLSLALASLAAFGLARYDLPFRRTLLLLMLGGNLLPPQILLIPVSKISEALGLYDSLYALIGVQVGFGVGFYVFVLHGFMRSIPPEIQQAAVIDGAGPWQIYRRIIMPLTTPALAALGALSFTWIFNDLLWAITVLRTDTKMPITASLIGLQGQFVSMWNVIAAKLGHRRRPDRRRIPAVPAPLRGRTQSGSSQVTPHDTTPVGTGLPDDRWLLRTENTTYAVALAGDGRWAELTAWGPHGVETGPSALDWSRRTHFITPADASPAEYIPYGLRPFTGADLVAQRPGEERGVWWRFTEAAQDGDRTLRLVFADDTLGLTAALHYEAVPGTDVILRWAELTCTGDTELRLERFDSAAVNIPVAGGARLTYLTGQWSQEFQRTQLDLTRGRFELASTQGVPGHAYAPWLAVQDLASPAEGATPTYGVALEWSGNWHLTTDAEPGGAVRVRAGRVPHEGAVRLAPGATLTTPGSPARSAPKGSTASPGSGTATNGT